MSDPRHAIAGRMVGRSGIVTFCHCGLGFFALYGTDGVETNESRRAARETADQRWDEHWKQAQPDQYQLVHPDPDPVDVVRDALRQQHGLIWSPAGIDRQARLAVNALRMAGILTDRPPDPGKETS